MGQRSCPHEESNVFTALPLSHRDSTMSYHEVHAYVARIQSDNYDKRHICEQNETETRRAQIYHLSYLKSFSKFLVKIHSLSETGAFFFLFSFSGEQRKAQETRLAQLEERELKKKTSSFRCLAPRVFILLPIKFEIKTGSCSKVGFVSGHICVGIIESWLYSYL